ncbi:hypothetical protein F750_4374 [Streptomyces sp. PAMC 26508]|nr:hypothetical protein F750_4374 [Streptomyces sp. PAMC 26508]
MTGPARSPAVPGPVQVRSRTVTGRPADVTFCPSHLGHQHGL